MTVDSRAKSLRWQGEGLYYEIDVIAIDLRKSELTQHARLQPCREAYLNAKAYEHPHLMTEALLFPSASLICVNNRSDTILTHCITSLELAVARPGNMGSSHAAGGALRAARSSFGPTIQKRSLQDVAITRTGKPIIRIQGGRSSLGGHTATVFGATGFLGRYIVNRLARQGCTVIIPFREEMAKRHLKVTGDLGRVVFNEYDLRNTQSIEESVRHSDIVYNLVGRMYPTKNFSLKDVHVEGTERIAEAVAKYDCDRFIHVSSWNADPNAPEEFLKTKVR